jgi:tRNA A-37 threonylcarbamoyl transferase component Bud32
MGAADTAIALKASISDHGNTTPEVRGDADTGEEEDVLIGTTLQGRYSITKKIGQGGMGAVYEATHELIGKRVAIKVLLDKYARKDQIVARLEQEARLASAIGHEHIIDITDFGTTSDGRTFVVMEFLEGESLAECLSREGKLPETRILLIAHQVASALGAAHAKGIIHRDVKPENVFLLRRKDKDFAKVVDFGISKNLRQTGEGPDSPRLTQTGMVLGTPLYMSPEQARGDDELDARVDIYALGVIMYEASTGRVPFVGSNYLSVISQVLNEDAKPPREIRPELSEEFEAIVQRAMAKDRDERYASATDLLADVNALVDDPTRSTERAKITGPRKKPVLRSKSPLKIAIWIALVAVVIAAVVTTVVMLFGGRAVVQRKQEVVVPPPPIAIDAGVAAIPVDAAPAVETMNVVIRSEPPGALVQVDGVEKGAAPVTVPLVVHDHFFEIIASAPGYEDKRINVNTYVNKEKQYTLKLKKLPKGAPIRPAPTGDKKGSGDRAKPVNKTGGELNGNPFNSEAPTKRP